MSAQSLYRYTLSTTANIKFDVVSFVLREGLSQLFRLELELASVTSSVEMSALLDSSVTLTIWKDTEPVRYVNGVVTKLLQGDSGFARTRFSMVVEPALARARLQSDNRIFQQQDSQAILSTLLQKNHVAHFQFHLTGSLWTREYCVQYAESDLTFIERLATEEGCFYYFEHTADSHILHFSNSTSLCSDGGTLLYNAMPAGDSPLPSIRSWRFETQLTTTQQTQRDYTFTNPAYNQQHQYFAQAAGVLGELPASDYEQYHFPGRYKQDAQGKPFTQYRLEFERREAEVAFAEGDDYRVAAGFIFGLTGHNTTAFNRHWLAVSVVHRGEQFGVLEEEAGNDGNHYVNHVKFIPSTTQWRPEPLLRPAIKGSQIAHIVGPKGEEIYCDEWGRVKIQFPWDRLGDNNENSSCWVRVSQAWAGAQFGNMAIPRIGDEVIVDFLEGDPDQPIIVGRTYHATTKPPYELPTHKTRMSIKSKTHKGKGYNELRFEDELGQEEVFIHAERDQRNVVKHDENTEIGNDRSEHVGGNETLTVNQNRIDTIKLNDNQNIGMNRLTNVGMTDTLNVALLHTINVLQDSQLNVGQDYRVEVGNNSQLTTEKRMTVSSQNLHVTGKDEIKLDSSGGLIHINNKGILLRGQVTIEGTLAIKHDGMAGGKSVKGECIPCKQAAAVGRPVNPILGIKMLNEPADFALQGLLPLVWTRRYYSDVAEVGWLGQGWRVTGMQRIVRREPQFTKKYDIEKRDENQPRFTGDATEFAKLSTLSSLYYRDEQGREIPLPNLTALNDPIYIQAEQIWVTRLGDESIQLSSQDKKRHFIFRAQPMQVEAHKHIDDNEHDEHNEHNKKTLALLCDFVLTEIRDNHGNRQQFIYLPTPHNDAKPAAIVDGNGRVFVLHFDNVAGKQIRLAQIALLSQPWDGLNLEQLQAENLPALLADPQTQTLVRYDYSDEGDLIRVRDYAKRVIRQFGYQNHIMTSHQDAAGLISYYEYNNYSPSGKVIRNHTNLGESWQFAYFPSHTVVTDALNRTDEYHFDEHQELIKRVFADGSQHRFERNELGQVLSQTDRAGRTTYYGYDARGQVTKITRPDNAMLHFLYDNNGQLIGQLDAMGAMTTFAYDDNGNLIKQLDALEQETTFSYNAAGLLVAIKDPLGNQTQFHYNPNHQLAERVDCSGQRTTFQYNQWGQLTHQTDALGNTTQYDYDDYQRLIKTTTADGSQTQFEYDQANRLTRHIDAKGNITEYTYSLDSLPIQRTNALGGTFHYAYDKSRRLVQLANENQATYHFYYDELDRLTQETGFDDKTTTYHYDETGALTQQLDWGVLMGTSLPHQPPQPIRVTEFAYNSLGLLVSQHSQQGEQHQRSRFDYDKNGRLTQAESNQHQLAFEYDKIGQLLKQTSLDLLADNPTPQVLTYRYDANGNRTHLCLPNDDRLHYLYYGSGHLTAIKLNNQLISEIERDSLHREIARTQGALTTHFKLDPMGRLREQIAHIEHKNSVLFNRTYGYDKLGDLTQSQTIQYGNQQQQTYRYDALGRIAQADDEIFHFDPAHNIVDQPNQRVQNNRLMAFAGNGFEYDSFGNLRKRVTSETDYQLYHYDLQNQLVRTEIHSQYRPTEVWHYRYDALGRRIAKVRSKNGEFLPNSKIEFIWDGSHLVQEINHPRNQTYSYIYTHPSSYEPLAQVFKENSNQMVHYYHCDQIGAPRELTNRQGKLIWQRSYQAWGQLKQAKPRTYQSHDSFRAEQEIHQPLRLQNQYFDEETGLHYNFFRYYDPMIGRFITQDPIGLQGGMNLYRLEGTVQNGTDPLGLKQILNIIVNNNGWFGTHAGVAIIDTDNPNNSILYDPNGSYVPAKCGQRYICSGSGDFFNTFDLNEYIQYQEVDGSDVYQYTFDLSDKEVERITNNILNNECGGVLYCAKCTSSVLNGGEGIFKNLGIYNTPNGLGDALDKLPELNKK